MNTTKITRNFVALRCAVCAALITSLFVLFPSATSHAQPTPEIVMAPEMNVGNPKRSAKLADLYKMLIRLENESQARQVEQAIWQIWLHHGDPKIDELMGRAMSARRESNYEKAVTILDQIIREAPDYAEGWNQRATIRFLQESYEESLADVAETLQREPNHFGALSGRAVIRLRQGKQGLAIQNILEALKVNPHLRERHMLKALGYEETKT